MCHRMQTLSLEELTEAMVQLEVTGRATVAPPSEGRPEAYPGARVPLLLPQGSSFEVAERSWGFDGPAGQGGGRSKLVFNTRLDTALRQLRQGSGLWAEALQSGRCLVPVRSFYETSRSRQAQFRFWMPGHSVFLLAAIASGDRFSVMTTEPNGVVGAVHTRMPLVLAPGESSIWLRGGFEQLADRSRVMLERKEA